jgi:hypothetical protein
MIELDAPFSMEYCCQDLLSLELTFASCASWAMRSFKRAFKRISPCRSGLQAIISGPKSWFPSVIWLMMAPELRAVRLLSNCPRQDKCLCALRMSLDLRSRQLLLRFLLQCSIIRREALTDHGFPNSTVVRQVGPSHGSGLNIS